MSPSGAVWAGFVEGMPLGAAVWRLDDPDDDASLRLVAANATAAAAVGFDLAAAVGKRVAEVFPASAERQRRALASTARGEAVAGSEGAYGDGVFAVRCIPLPDRCAGVLFENVTERRRADGSLRESEARYRALAEATDEGVCIHENGRMLEVNDAFEKIYGYTRAEAVGMLIDELIAPESLAAVHADAASRKDARREYLARRKDGSTLPIEAAVRSCTYQGRAARVAVMRDLTEQRRVEAERRELEGKLLFAERMASVGTLAAGVAHEINNPLSYLIANVRLVEAHLRALARGSPLDPAVQGALASDAAALDEAREGAERVHRIVADLKTFARAEEDRRGPVDVRRVLEAALRLADHEIRGRARLVREIADVPPVLGNEARLGQVFLSLVVHAAKAFAPGAPEANEIRVSARTSDAGAVVVEVRDTGPSIPAEACARLFEPFFALRSASHEGAASASLRAGTGLGLSVSHAIVTALGGEIVAESPPGEGCCLRVVLPAAEAPALPGVAASGPPPAPAEPRRGRILIVDDEPMVGRMVERALGHAHRITSVLSAKDALSLLEAGERYEVILCDVMMPAMTGMDLYERVVAMDAAQAARMVFLSGGAFTQRARDFLEQHPALEKPFDLSALEAAIQARLG